MGPRTFNFRNDDDRHSFWMYCGYMTFSLSIAEVDQIVYSVLPHMVTLKFKEATFRITVNTTPQLAGC